MLPIHRLQNPACII